MGDSEQKEAVNQSNGIIETAQNVQQDVQETKQMGKDGANLIANAASGNIVGAAKDSINLLKNKKFRQILKIILVIVTCFVLLILGVIGVMAEVANDRISRTSSNICSWLFAKNMEGSY